MTAAAGFRESSPSGILFTFPAAKTEVAQSAQETKLLSYEEVFQRRGNLYNHATQLCPEAREIERRHLLDRLPIKPGQLICDAPAGGGYVADGIMPLGAKVICVEPSEAFAETISEDHAKRICSLENLDLEDSAVDHVVSLAGLHHLEAPVDFFQEAARVVKPDGHIAVADVQAGSPVDYFLNQTVHNASETGHDGNFFRDGELTELLEKAGFVDVREKCEQFSWTFPNEEVMAEFCWHLFGMIKLTPEEVLKRLAEDLGYASTSSGIELQWSLIYAQAKRCHD